MTDRSAAQLWSVHAAHVGATLGVERGTFTGEGNETYESFDQMGLNHNLLRGVFAYGFERPSAIQQKGIVPFTKEQDVVLQAQCGKGKTVAFCAGILNNLDYNLLECQGLVLAPTRELAQQIEKVMRALGDYLQVKCHACVGGTSGHVAARILFMGVHVVVGTPGRVLDMLESRWLRPDSIKMFVLDEADEMLPRGRFKDQIYDIFQLLPPKLQIGVSSATLSPEVLEFTRTFMDKPARACESHSLEGIKQFYVNIEKEDWKLDALCDLCSSELAATQLAVFAGYSVKVDWLADKMRERDHTVSATHGDMDKNTHEFNMREFRAGSTRVLITTDLLAHIGMQRVPYDLPKRPDTYLRRISRFSLGHNAVAISFMTQEDERVLLNIQRFSNTVIEELPSNVADLPECAVLFKKLTTL